jgi:hypothetical protein
MMTVALARALSLSPSARGALGWCARRSPLIGAALVTALLVSASARAATPPPYSWAKNATAYVGAGGVPNWHGSYFIFTADWGLHPFDGAFSTGTSISVAADFHQSWSLGALGVFVQLDLTYLFLSGLWAVDPPADFPFRLQLGSRVGVDVSRSVQTRPELTEPQVYWLARPSLHSYLDLEFPIPGARHFCIVLRSAIDTPASLHTIYRYNFSLGFSGGYE